MGIHNRWGSTWKKGAGLEVDFHDVHFHASNPNIAYVGYDQGLGRVDFGNYSMQWVWDGAAYVQESQPNQIELGKKAGFNTSQIYYGDYFPASYGDAYLMGQQDGGSFASVNSIQKRIFIGDGGAMFVNKQDPTKAYGSTQKGNIKATTIATAPVSSGDYTSIGSIYNNHPNWITQFAGNNADGAQMYIADNTSIQRTSNSGASFTSIASHSWVSSVKVAVENATNPIVYAIGRQSASPYGSDLMRIANANSTPSINTNTNVLDYWVDGTADQISIDPNNNSTVYITGSRGSAFKVTGANTASPVITSIKGNITDVNFNIVIGIPGRTSALLARTNVGLFYSLNGGASWTLSDKIPYTQVTDLKFRSSDNRLFVFTHRRGAWATDVNFPVSTEELNTTMIKVFPNPASELITIISDELKNPQVIIYDIKGNSVLKTTQLTKIPVGALARGSYVLHVQDGQTTIAIEQIILK